MKAYEITQCLTEGIREVEILENAPKPMQTVSWEYSRSGYSDGRKFLRTARLNGSVFLKYDEALKAANAFVEGRIENLEKQIKKLRSLNFLKGEP